MDKQTEANWGAVHADLKNGVYPVEIRVAANELLAEASSIKERITGDNAFVRVVRRYVSREARKVHRGERDEALCACTLPRCDLKQGIVPGLVVQAETLDDGISEFAARHATPHVLEEAAEHFDQLGAELDTLLRDARTMLEEEELVQTDYDGVDVVNDDGTLAREAQPWIDEATGAARTEATD
jgi:hypothetical protein